MAEAAAPTYTNLSNSIEAVYSGNQVLTAIGKKMNVGIEPSPNIKSVNIAIPLHCDEMIEISFVFPN